MTPMLIKSITVLRLIHDVISNICQYPFLLTLILAKGVRRAGFSLKI